MAEAGIVASILGVAGAGFRLSLILNAVSCEVSNAPIEIHHISKTVTLFSLMLKQTGTVLQAIDSVHSHDAVEAAKQVADESTRVFDEINDMLDRVRTKRPDGSYQPSIHQRFQWCFKKGRIDYLLAQLESLELSLSLMLQVLQIGKLMAATSRTDTPEQVRNNTAAIQQERAEAQNILIVRHIQIQETDRLFKASEQDGDLTSPISPASESSQLTIEAPPPEYTPSTALVKLPLHSLGEVDHMLDDIHNSSKDMVRLSAQAIDPLLEKWTRWHEIREERHRNPSTRYVPKVDALHEDDEDTPAHRKSTQSDSGPRGYYIEGVTTDWRRPHSVEARREAHHLRKKYSGYQPSVSTAGSDNEDSPASNGSGRRRSKRHVINSSSDTSDSDTAQHRRRRDSVVSSQGRSPKPITKEVSFTSSSPSTGTARNAPAASATPIPSTRGTSSSYSNNFNPNHAAHRPYPTPTQQGLHHSVSSPLPPIHTYNAPNPYASTPVSPGYSNLPSYGQLTPQARQYDRAYPPRAQPRPVSRDGIQARSPSRPTFENNSYDYYRTRDDKYDKRDDRERREEKRRKEKHKNLRDGAAKGLIGAGAIAGFLEALEGLSL